MNQLTSLLLGTGATFTICCSVQAQIQPVGNLLLYHDFENNLDDGSSVGNSHAGTALNGASFAADTPNATAGASSGLYDGLDDIITYDNGTDIDMNNGTAFSLAMWIKPTEAGSQRAFFGKSPNPSLNGGGGTHTPALYWSNGTVVYDVFWVNGMGASGATLDEWTHVAVTSDGTTTNLFINGAFATSKEFTGGGGVNEGANGLDPWTVSTGDSINDSSPTQGPFPANLFAGNIDEFAFWDVELTSDAVTDVFMNGVEASTPLPGDTDGDGDIDDTDLGTAFSNYTGPNGSGKTAAQGDTDGDGDVDDSDLGTLFSAYTGPLGPANVPEPTSLALIGLGGLALIRRRRA